MLDPSFTLFGKRIQVNGDGESEVEDSPRSNNEEESSIEKSSSDEQLVDEVTKEIAEEESMGNDQQDDSSAEAMDESTNAPAMSETTDQTEKAIECEKDSEPEQGEKETNDGKKSQQKQLKKPDKILPCPRCNSMDTKFCYYNNYNVNQPRHFCKSCQRYWTAGGTMRNVPVGAGRRKNKSSASRYCHITVSEALQAARFDVSNGVHHPGIKNNGTVLTFGSDRPLCESMTSVLNIADKKACGTTRNGFHNVDHVVPVPSRGMEDDHSSGSTVTTSSIVEDPSRKGAQEPQQHMNGFTNQMPYFQWPYMWNPAAGPVPPPFCPSAYPMPMYPPPYWNGAPVPWNVSWVPQYSPSQNSPGSNQSSPTLGKHTRNGEMITPTDNDRSSKTPTSTTTTPTTTSTVLMPKTLRIDDPDEAAKSSIWTTLGIKKDKADSARKGFFNSFNSKEAERTDSDIEAPEAFKANPVALFRSFSFQEKA